MLTNLAAGFDSFVSNIMGSLKFHINDYCEIATTEGQYNLISHEGAVCTVLEYHGFMSLISNDEYREYLDMINSVLKTYLNSRSFSVQVVFVSDNLSEQEIKKIQAPSYETARNLKMYSMAEILDDARSVLARTTSSEKCYIALWTFKSALDPTEAKIERDRLAKLGKGSKVPPLRAAQNPFIISKQLVDQHNSFVESAMTRMIQGGASVSMMNAHEIIGDQKRFLYRESVARTWKPILPGDRYMTRFKVTADKDMSVFLPPPLDSQIMLGEAEIGSSKSDIDFTDSRAAKIGDYAFAPVYVNVMPQEPRLFNDIFKPLNKIYTTDSKGNTSKMPYAISFTLAGDGISSKGLAKIGAGILGVISQKNRNNVAAQNKLSAQQKLGGCVVKYQISAVTWAKANEPDELSIRRSRLMSTISSWGNISPTDETGDPILGLTTTIPALTPISSAPSTAAPLEDVLLMLPLSRPGSVFEGGHAPYRTNDGKVMRWQMFSSHQSAWITLIWAIMGSGKSVWLNRNNIEMCLMPGLKQLPYICAVDIGVSSKGFIDLIKYSLPEEDRHLATYIRIQNTPEYAVNQMDTKTGCRYLLPHERSYVCSFILEMVTPAGRQPHKYMSDLISRLVDRAYKLLSDLEEGSSPAEYAHSADPRVTKAVDELGIHHNSQTKWWDIVDALALEHGRYVEAEIAQRYAVPQISTLIALTAEPTIQTEFANALDDNVSVIEDFKMRASAAITNYRIFDGYTRFDVGSSRVMAIDLQDVVTTGSAEANKSASLFFLMARTCFVRKINLSEEDLKIVNPKYRAYYERLYRNNCETPKRIAFDEYHKTGGSENLRKIIDTDGREGRKWFLEIMLASQKPDDFGAMAEIATAKIVLHSGTAESQEKVRRIYGLTRTEELALKEFVHGPGRYGATFLAKVATKMGEKTQLYTSQMGPITMWALTTTAEDRTLRSELYKLMPNPIMALRMLRQHYPTGSCKEAVDAMKADPELLREYMGDAQQDSDNPFAFMLAQRIYADYLKRAAAGEFEPTIYELSEAA